MQRRVAGALVVWVACVSMVDAMAADATTHAMPAVVGDAVARPLTTTPGDVTRGRAIVVDRHVGLCLLCHPGPFPDERFQGTLAPDLAGVGSRYGEDQLRLRIVDAKQVNPASIMPAYYRVVAGARVGEAWRGKPVLDAQQIEDVVAFLVTLK